MEHDCICAVHLEICGCGVRCDVHMYRSAYATIYYLHYYHWWRGERRIEIYGDNAPPLSNGKSGVDFLTSTCPANK